MFHFNRTTAREEKELIRARNCEGNMMNLKSQRECFVGGKLK